MSEIEVDEAIVNKLKTKIVLMESSNLKTHMKSDPAMVEMIKNLIKEEINVNKKD